jgi:hypothetical protein
MLVVSSDGTKSVISALAQEAAIKRHSFTEIVKFSEIRNALPDSTPECSGGRTERLIAKDLLWLLTVIQMTH